MSHLFGAFQNEIAVTQDSLREMFQASRQRRNLSLFESPFSFVTSIIHLGARRMRRRNTSCSTRDHKPIFMLVESRGGTQHLVCSQFLIAGHADGGRRCVSGFWQPLRNLHELEHASN